MEEIKYIDIKEFVEKGYLQEVNRRFFHVLGLALEVKVDDEGNYSIGGVWDYREDKEGIVFGDSLSTEKVLGVQRELEEKIEERQKIFGWFIQPYPKWEDGSEDESQDNTSVSE